MVAKSVASGALIGSATGIYEGIKGEANPARIIGGLPGAGFGTEAAISSTGPDAHPTTTTTHVESLPETTTYVPGPDHLIEPGDIPVGEDGSAALYMHTEIHNGNVTNSFYVPGPDHLIEPGDIPVGEDGTEVLYAHTEMHDHTVTTTGIGSLPATAMAAGVGAIGTGIVVGALASILASKVARGATAAIVKAGGFRGVAGKLRKNPVVSVQTAVQRMTANVFSIDRLPGDERAKARAVVALREHWSPWVETAFTLLPPMRQVKILASLKKTFQIENYHADDRNDVEAAIAPARSRMITLLGDPNGGGNPISVR